MEKQKPIIDNEGRVFETPEEMAAAEEEAKVNALYELQAKDDFETGHLKISDYADGNNLEDAIKNRVMELIDEHELENTVEEADIE